MTETVTSMSKRRFEELRQTWLDGSLLEKWQGRTAETKADRVEARQIRVIASLAAQDEIERLVRKDWKRLTVTKNDCGDYFVKLT